MRGNWTPARRQLEFWLEDGEWHTFDEIFPYVSLLIDPRYAARIWQREHDHIRRYRGTLTCAERGSCPHYNAERVVARGRWGWFIHVLRSGRANGRYEVEHWEGRHRGRMRLVQEVTP
jgi:hypothetical protein